MKFKNKNKVNLTCNHQLSIELDVVGLTKLFI